MLTQQRLKELLRYDPETGVFTWLVQKGSAALAGNIAGTFKTPELAYAAYVAAKRRLHNGCTI